MVESNREHGEGRSDVVVKDLRHGRAAVFELKYTKKFDKLSEECDTALQQIDDRMYSKEFEDSFDEVLCFGIAFYKKRCIVKKNRVLEVPRLLAVIETDDWGTFLKSE